MFTTRALNAVIMYYPRPPRYQMKIYIDFFPTASCIQCFVSLHVLYLCICVKPCWSVRPGAVQLGKAAGNATTGPNEPFAHPVSAGKKPSFSPSICPMSSLVPTVGLSRLLQHPDGPVHRFLSPSKFRTGTTTGTNGSSTLRRVKGANLYALLYPWTQHSGTVYFATWGHE